MSPRTQRTLRVLTMAAPLRAYAASLQSDVNAAFMLVHHAMAGALANHGENPGEPGVTETQLRADMARRNAGDQKAGPDGNTDDALR